MAEMLPGSGPAAVKITGPVAGFVAQVDPVKSSFNILSMPTRQGIGTILRGKASLPALTLSDFPAKTFLLFFTFPWPSKKHQK
jgi:hypothetical protein